jgi:hypothetical protein
VLRSVRPLPARRQAPGLRTPRATERSCSVHVVSHHLDGLLRTDGASTVAARSRPWGSPRFPLRAPSPTLSRRSLPASTPTAFPRCTHPAKIIPARSASPLTIPPEEAMFTSGRYPLAVYPIGTPDARAARGLRGSPWRLARSGSTSRSCSANRSFATVRRCQRPMTLSFHGLLYSLGHRLPTHPGWGCLGRLAIRLRMADLRESHVKELHQGAFPR